MHISKLTQRKIKVRYPDRAGYCMFADLCHFQGTSHLQTQGKDYRSSVHDIAYLHHRNESSQKTMSSFPSYR